MKGKKRKGATLSMVIITMVVVATMVAIIASTIDTSTTQTIRLYQYMNAKYVATSGTQLALGAYYGDEGERTLTPLYEEFGRRAEGKSTSTAPITASHDFPNGKAEIQMTGAFEKDPETGVVSKDRSDYNITIKSKTEVKGTGQYYVHTVVINWEIEGIRSEKGGLTTPDF